MPVDLPDDFSDYAEGIQKQKALEALKLERLQEYEEWLNSTWSGGAVRLVQNLGNAPFIVALRESFADGKDSVMFRITSLLAKISFVVILFLAVRALAAIVQKVIGSEIVMEQVVVVEKSIRSGSSKQHRGKKD